MKYHLYLWQERKPDGSWSPSYRTIHFACRPGDYRDLHTWCCKWDDDPNMWRLKRNGETDEGPYLLLERGIHIFEDGIMEYAPLTIHVQKKRHDCE